MKTVIKIFIILGIFLIAILPAIFIQNKVGYVGVQVVVAFWLGVFWDRVDKHLDSVFEVYNNHLKNKEEK